MIFCTSVWAIFSGRRSGALGVRVTIDVASCMTSAVAAREQRAVLGRLGQQLLDLLGLVLVLDHHLEEALLESGLGFLDLLRWGCGHLRYLSSLRRRRGRPRRAPRPALPGCPRAKGVRCPRSSTRASSITGVISSWTASVSSCWVSSGSSAMALRELRVGRADGRRLRRRVGRGRRGRARLVRPCAAGASFARRGRRCALGGGGAARSGVRGRGIGRGTRRGGGAAERGPPAAALLRPRRRRSRPRRRAGSARSRPTARRCRCSRRTPAGTAARPRGPARSSVDRGGEHLPRRGKLLGRHCRGSRFIHRDPREWSRGGVARVSPRRRGARRVLRSSAG